VTPSRLVNTVGRYLTAQAAEQEQRPDLPALCISASTSASIARAVAVKHTPAHLAKEISPVFSGGMPPRTPFSGHIQLSLFIALSLAHSAHLLSACHDRGLCKAKNASNISHRRGELNALGESLRG